MTAEEWRPVPDLPFYQASSEGRIRSCHPRWREPRVLSGRPNIVSGYLYLQLRRDGETVIRAVHSMVAAAFYGPRPDGMEVRHLDGNRTNNEVANLTYGTKAQNMQDALAHGTHHHASKTHCVRGHAFDEVNTYLASTGQRCCRACRRVRNAERNKAAA